MISQGYQILEANFFNRQGKRLGEIDLIAKDPQSKEIVFVEVKARAKRSNCFQEVLPEENLTFSKFSKLLKAAEYYLSKNQLWNLDWRIDVVAIVFDFSRRKMSIKQIKRIRF